MGIKTAGVFLFFCSTALAAESLVVIPGESRDLKRILQRPEVLTSDLVFSPSERDALIKLARPDLAQTHRVEVAGSANVFRRWVEKWVPGVRAEENSVRISLSDTLEERQWGLHNTGKAQAIQIDDISTYPIDGVAGEDVQVVGLPPEPAGVKIRVAVLDTGIDYDHPDLKTQVVRDVAECTALQSYKECLKTESQTVCDQKWAAIDANRNGYPLDCSGWNVAAGRNKISGVYGSWDAADDAGHGTHVSGIIAGAGNGIRGVSQAVEILPVKVIKTAPTSPIRPQAEGVSAGASSDLPPTQEKELRWATGFTDLIARGMLYALRADAKIINMSLAWPAVADSPLMREMVRLARDRGVLIVAAAGNDSADSRVFPCQYEGVICVASHGPDGAISHFSNFGSFVDVAAPGLNILSSWPLEKRSNNFTEQRGYEIKNGTSMAAPFVAGALGRLLATGISSGEAYARLMAGAREIPAGSPKYLRFGNIDLAKSFRLDPQPLILPETKRPIKISWDRNAREIPFSISLKNSWADAGSVTVSAGFEADQGVRLAQSQWEFLDWPSASSRRLDTALWIDDSRVDGRLLIRVQVGTGGRVRSFRIPIEITVPVTPGISDPNVVKIPIQGGSISDQADLRSVSALDERPGQDYIAFERKKIQLLREKVQQYEIVQEAAFDPPDGDLLLIQRIDLNLDGQIHYVLIYRTPPPIGKQKPGLQFLYFNESLQLEQKIAYDNEVASLAEDFKWFQVRDGSRSVLVPLWLGGGTTPELEKPKPDPWNPNPEDPVFLRIYYLTAAGLRSVSIPDQYGLVQVLAQTPAQRISGQVSVVLSEGDGYLLKYSVADLVQPEVNTRTVVRPLALPKYRMLQGLRNITEIVSLNKKADITGVAFSGASTRGRLRTTLVYFNDSSRTQALFWDGFLRPPTFLDSVMRTSGVFLGQNRRGIFSQSHYQLQYLDLRTGLEASTSLDRFSFLPAFIFNKTLFPVVVDHRDSNGVSEDRVPAILIPESLGAADASEVILPVFDTTGYGLRALSRPARFRLTAGPGCTAMGNPVSADTKNPTQIAFFCSDHFIRVPLSY